MLGACALALAVPVAWPAGAAAMFDPPDGTVINANLPAIVPFAYQLDLTAICAAEQPALVTAWLRTPTGQTLQPAEAQTASGLHEKSFGADLSLYGVYEHWVTVRCRDGGEHTVEQGRFTIGGDESAGPGGQPGPGTEPAQPRREPTRSQRRACKVARGSLGAARKRLARTRRALARRDTAARRRAVKRARKQVKAATKLTRRRCR